MLTMFKHETQLCGKYGDSHSRTQEHLHLVLYICKVKQTEREHHEDYL